MNPPGHPKGEYRSAQPEGTPESSGHDTAARDGALEAAARHLHALQRAGRAGPRIGIEWRPRNAAEGWRVQRRVSELRGTQVRGWKCGLPQADRWVVAALHDAAPAGASVVAPPGPAGRPRIEPELAFELRHALPPRQAPYTADEVDAAIGSVRLAVEVLGCRYADAAAAGGPELMADSLWHQALVLGPPVDGATVLPAEPAFTLTITLPDRSDTTLPARHPDGNPRRALHWMAEFLRAQGVGLAAGDVVITGSLAGAVELPYGQPALLRYGDFGSLTLTLVAP